MTITAVSALLRVLNDPIPYVKAPNPHPEEWTQTGVHNMEKREAYNMWRSDMEATIMNCSKQLDDLFEKYPQ